MATPLSFTIKKFLYLIDSLTDSYKFFHIGSAVKKSFWLNTTSLASNYCFEIFSNSIASLSLML
jgi:hypothetical protein